MLSCFQSLIKIHVSSSYFKYYTFPLIVFHNISVLTVILFFQNLNAEKKNQNLMLTLF